MNTSQKRGPTNLEITGTSSLLISTRTENTRFLSLSEPLGNPILWLNFSEPLFTRKIDCRKLKAGVTSIEDMVIRREDLNLAKQRGTGTSSSLMIIVGIVGFTAYAWLSQKN